MLSIHWLTFSPCSSQPCLQCNTRDRVVFGSCDFVSDFQVNELYVYLDVMVSLVVLNRDENKGVVFTPLDLNGV